MILKNLLFYRLVIFNTLGAVALFCAYKLGFVSTLTQHDALGVVYVLAGLLFLGVFGTMTRGWKISQTMNAFKNGEQVPTSTVKKMFYKNGYLQDMAGWAVLIGLFGNAYGLLTALSSGQDALLEGAGIAFGSTVAGILVALLLEINYTMLRTATGVLLEDVLEGR